jgi:hypothetical protein
MRVLYGEHLSIEIDGRTITLEEGTTSVVLAPDEDRIAYTRGDRAIVRAIPAGHVIAEVRLDAR